MPKIKCFVKFTPASLHHSINSNHRQIPLAGTNSKLSQVIQFEKNNHKIF